MRGSGRKTSGVVVRLPHTRLLFFQNLATARPPNNTRTTQCRPSASARSRTSTPWVRARGQKRRGGAGTRARARWPGPMPSRFVPSFLRKTAGRSRPHSRQVPRPHSGASGGQVGRSRGAAGVERVPALSSPRPSLGQKRAPPSRPPRPPAPCRPRRQPPPTRAEVSVGGWVGGSGSEKQKERGEIREKRRAPSFGQPKTTLHPRLDPVSRHTPHTSSSRAQVIVEKAEKSDIPDIDKKK